MTDDDDTQDYVRPWIDLTDEELDKLAVDAGIITWVRKVYDNIDRKFYDLPLGEGMTGDAVCLKQFARLVEEALKKKLMTKEEALAAIKLLSALESWALSQSARLPDYVQKDLIRSAGEVFEDLIRSMEVLEVLEEQP